MKPIILIADKKKKVHKIWNTWENSIRDPFNNVKIQNIKANISINLIENIYNINVKAS